MMDVVSQMFHDNAPLSAAGAAAIILEGVRREQWRILVGDDAHALDAAVRADPEQAYEGTGFLETLSAAGSRVPVAPPAE